MSEGQKQLVRPVKFVHQKAASFRTYHADGTWGVISAMGNFHMQFYVECPKSADAVINPVKADGSFTGESQMIGAGENDPDYYIVTRDFQCNVVLSVLGAVNLREQLDVFIRSRQSIQSLQQPSIPGAPDQQTK